MSILKTMLKKTVITIISNGQIPIPNRSKRNMSTKSQIYYKNKSKDPRATNYYPSTSLRTSLLTTYFDSTPRYTLGKYRKRLQATSYKLKTEISCEKISKIEPYIKILSLFPQIKLIGLSGSVAMFNADVGHDVDLFIITAKNRLFTGRFFALLLAQIFGIRRRRYDPESRNYKLRTTNYQLVSDKVCLNLFFDESNLSIPKRKRSEYVAHEALQMKPLVSKDGAYERFLKANRWVFDTFPNAKRSNLLFVISNLDKSRKSSPNYQFLITNSFGNIIEKIFRILQLFFIRKHQTTELISDSQLWFHPDDFEKKLINKI